MYSIWCQDDIQNLMSWICKAFDIKKIYSQATKKGERDPAKDSRSNYNNVAAQVKLLTKQCKADKWKRTCMDIDLRKERRKA